MFCTGCGIQSADSDLFCGGCGNAQKHTSAPAVFRVRQATQPQDVPDGVKGWSWGAFLLTWIWAIGNNTWVGLLALIPYVNVAVAVWLGLKGREMAWRNRHWDSIEHFNRVQRAWSQWAIGIVAVLTCIIVTSMTTASFMGTSETADEATESVVQQHGEAVTARRPS